jgi:hypothetical protein
MTIPRIINVATADAQGRELDISFLNFNESNSTWFNETVCGFTGFYAKEFLDELNVLSF